MEERIGPGQPQRNEVRHQVTVVSDRCPRLRRNLIDGIIGETADIQNAAGGSGLRRRLRLLIIVGGARYLTLDLAQFWGQFDFAPGELLLQEDLELLEGGITPDEIQELSETFALTFPERVNES